MHVLWPQGGTHAAGGDPYNWANPMYEHQSNRHDNMTQSDTIVTQKDISEHVAQKVIKIRICI
jgi:hypothetical protein